jgi:hypothetical protein
MPSWGNTDAEADKPKFPRERLVRLALQTTSANTGVLGGVAGGNTVIRVADVTGITVGQFVYDDGVKLSTSGKDNFFKSNNTVLAISGANVVLTSAVTALILNGAPIYFANTITYTTTGAANTVANVFSDTILVSPGRMANTQGTTYGSGSTVANTRIGSINQGWNLIQRKINSDGTVRFLKETLVALSNVVNSNTSSANTSANAIFGGL